MNNDYEALAKQFKDAMDVELRAGVRAMIDVRHSSGKSHDFVLPIQQIAYDTAAELIEAVQRDRKVEGGDMYAAFSVFVISFLAQMVVNVVGRAGVDKGNMQMLGKCVQDTLSAMRVSAMTPLEQITAMMELRVKRAEQGDKL